MTNFKQIASNLDVTSEQIGAAHLVFHKDGNFYQVESAHSSDQYDVRYSKEIGFTCSCKAGLHGFSSVKHPSGTCWHVRAAVACSLEMKQALAEQDRLNAQPVGMYSDQDTETVKRVLASKGAKVTRGALPQSRPFSMMR